MSVRRANGHRLDPVQPRFASWHIYVHRRQPPCVRISPVCARERVRVPSGGVRCRGIISMLWSGLKIHFFHVKIT